MTNLFTLGFVALTIASGSMASETRLGFDGCYQLYKSQSMYPVICLQGTAEEGIAGAGVRLAIFGTNTNKVIKCATSSGSAMDFTSFTFMMNGKEELHMTVRQEQEGRKQGEVKLGKTVLDFSEVDDQNTDRLLDIANKSCQN
jgi:hypothetical protein